MENGIPRTGRKMCATLCLLGLALMVLVSATPAQSTADQELAYKYMNMPAEFQALCALYKLDRLIAREKAAGNSDRARQYEQGRTWLKEAINKYNEYAFVNPVSPGEQEFEERKRRDIPPKSPLGMWQHVWRAQEGMHQLIATRNLSGDPPGMSYEEIQARHKAMDKAAQTMDKAVAVLEAGRGWKSVTDGMFFNAQVPPRFMPGKHLDYRLYMDWRAENSREVAKALFVRVTKKGEAAYANDYQEKALEREKKIHADLTVDIKGQSYPGIRGNWARYAYTWKGMQLQALLFHRVSNKYVLEIIYLAEAGRFDAEEAEGIVRSFESL